MERAFGPRSHTHIQTEDVKCERIRMRSGISEMVRFELDLLHKNATNIKNEAKTKRSERETVLQCFVHFISRWLWCTVIHSRARGECWQSDKTLTAMRSNYLDISYHVRLLPFWEDTKTILLSASNRRIRNLQTHTQTRPQFNIPNVFFLDILVWFWLNNLKNKVLIFSSIYSICPVTLSGNTHRRSPRYVMYMTTKQSLWANCIAYISHVSRSIWISTTHTHDMIIIYESIAIYCSESEQKPHSDWDTAGGCISFWHRCAHVCSNTYRNWQPMHDKQ